MNIPYRTRRTLNRVGTVALILLLVFIVTWLCWVVWLQRYVIYTDDGGGKYSLMRINNGLEVSRIDIVPGRNDNSFQTLGKIDKAVFAEVANVARVKPNFAIIVQANGLGCFSVIPEVAHHYQRARNTNFALLANG